MPTPVVYPSRKQFIGLAKETTQGTAVTPITATVPVNKFTPSPKYTWLDDTSFRGSMTMLSGVTQGVGWEEWAIDDSPAFYDTLPYFLNNLLGDITDSGTNPVVHAISTLNTGTGQPGSLTLVDWQGPPSATFFARVYPGACVSEIVLKGNAESTFITWSAKGLCWPSSVIGAAPTAATSTDQPMAAWRAKLGLAGPASGGTQVNTMGDWEITLTRQLKAQFTSQGVQTPFVIFRGALTAAGKMNFTVPADESNSVTYLTNNTQPQVQLVADNGLTLANNRNLQIDVQLAAFKVADIKRDAEAVGYATEFSAVDNATNAGASGGLSPIKVTVKNAVVAGTY